MTIPIDFNWMKGHHIHLFTRLNATVLWDKSICYSTCTIHLTRCTVIISDSSISISLFLPFKLVLWWLQLSIMTEVIIYPYFLTRENSIHDNWQISHKTLNHKPQFSINKDWVHTTHTVKNKTHPFSHFVWHCIQVNQIIMLKAVVGCCYLVNRCSMFWGDFVWINDWSITLRFTTLKVWGVKYWFKYSGTNALCTIFMLHSHLQLLFCLC